IRANAAIFDFALSATDMALMDSLDTHQRLGPDPDTFGF
ncbi:MAG: aldo/keto reductase, partial [Victivallales bacterium]|nr:aldo/keto reductase [Victivallales bacterium]